jgi:dihydrofolate reductase
MSKVFFDVGISLDGFMAGENRGPQNPMGGMSMRLHEWMFEQEYFLKLLHLPGPGKKGTDNEIVEATFDRVGAYILGRRMFEEGERSWPDDGPFNAPAYVLTNTPREPWQRKGKNVFYFVTEGIDQALILAHEAAGNKDVRICGGAHTIRQYLAAGLIDDFTIHLAPVLLGKGLPLFDGQELPVSYKPKYAITSEKVTHLGWERVHRV